MDVFKLRDQVIDDYKEYVLSFLTIRDQRIQTLVNERLESGFLWPDPLIQLNPAFEEGETLQTLVDEGILHPQCLDIFRINAEGRIGPLIHPYRHQVEGIRAARAGDSYVLTTGTGSGKSLAYIVPIVDHVLRQGGGRGIQAIVVYPMNALANSQMLELGKFLGGDGAGKATFASYTGQLPPDERQRIVQSPPDILLTNYAMLELILTRPFEGALIQQARGLRFLVLDELHAYRGRQGADVAMLMRRVRQACQASDVIHIGTSATLAGEASWPQQQNEVARIASDLFGAPIAPRRVIGESLRRVTPATGDGAAFRAALRRSVEGEDVPRQPAAFIRHPLASWIESTLGVRGESESGRLVRCPPLPLRGEASVSEKLAQEAEVPQEQCEAALRRMLLKGSSLHREDSSSPIFAFRLHQFVSKGESVYASPEAEQRRYLTLDPQQYVPESGRQKTLLPVAFCRECGQEYYLVRRIRKPGHPIEYLPRELSDTLNDEDSGEAGFLYIDTRDPWPSDPEEELRRLPESWTENRKGNLVLTSKRRDRRPQSISLSSLGTEAPGGLRAHYMRAPFLFCLRCRVEYGARQTSDFGKLATLGSEGRSTATTVTSLSIIRKLRDDRALDEKSRKLLSFTDNRQDASLQAGHFNDFVEIAQLRTALWKALQTAGAEGIRHDELTRRVFDAMGLDMAEYAANPEVRFVQLEETQRAFRQALGYCLYRDLSRGWRVTSPNLEQCGLLDMQFVSLVEFCSEDGQWAACCSHLAQADPMVRYKTCKTLLDYMRRELAIRVSYLNPLDQEGMRQTSGQYLIPPWSLDSGAALERGTVVFPHSRPRTGRSADYFRYLSSRGNFAGFLNQPWFLKGRPPLKLDDKEVLIEGLMETLSKAGFLHPVVPPMNGRKLGGYQLNASVLLWTPGAGEAAFQDPIRVPNAPDGGLRTNPFFREFYKLEPRGFHGLHAREHTAQVPSTVRQQREDDFREARLPILFCSPTMELGVDIAELNVVNLRNIPPTPANYAQRSGRAGRSGQPALVLSYCAAGSPHDQYFFRRPKQMVSGAVKPPRIDLANEDLLSSHVHAIWLSESGLSLGSSLRDIIDIDPVDSGPARYPSLNLKAEVQERLDHLPIRRRTLERSRRSLRDAVQQLLPEGDVDDWLTSVLNQVPQSFNAACDRWRGLYRAARHQESRQRAISLDASRDSRSRSQAEKLRQEAVTQLKLLEGDNHELSDFSSYRYFAGEGFLPGYNFPRLPLSAYLPGRRRGKGEEDFLTRPRFLAISEFGPRSIVYHEGARYVINRVILPVESEGQSILRRAASCRHCGYLHAVDEDPSPDLCQRCGEQLPQALGNLFRMQNVSTLLRDRINSDEEERLRLGYEIRTGIRFARRRGAVSKRTATLKSADGEDLATLEYGDSTTLWRINLGWRRGRNRQGVGFDLDMERGYWGKSAQSSDDPDDPMSKQVQRVIPFVEDRRNALLITPSQGLDSEQAASLQAALKSAIQVHYQIEDRELAAEPLPDAGERRLILFYEASEGGAGVLRRLVAEPDQLPQVARLALELCHFDPAAGADQGRHGCEAACYDCLLSYYNQMDHRLLDRQKLPEILLPWTAGAVQTSPSESPRDDHLEGLLRLADSELERRWLRRLDQCQLRLPSEAQYRIEACAARVDFFYRDDYAAVFIDGPLHDSAQQRAKDAAQEQCLTEMGYSVIRFRHDEDWDLLFRKFPNVFGRIPEAMAPSGSGAAGREASDPVALHESP